MRVTGAGFRATGVLIVLEQIRTVVTGRLLGLESGLVAQVAEICASPTSRPILKVRQTTPLLVVSSTTLCKMFCLKMNLLLLPGPAGLGRVSPNRTKFKALKAAMSPRRV